ncbi:MAG: hypothetical protein HETSPECPRED_006524 [Heterodermia speciosa]|uniref:Major facilitator superfamily (MFS) profile domain-containing protein n=1 Tax=Heterodermia speciosa TaxID=116794 RepID=A0A8H3FMB4_9LECA|nr:MAG: hypothetical protein HETSPECPRED_006524 [Heterodermia speciosa]
MISSPRPSDDKPSNSADQSPPDEETPLLVSDPQNGILSSPESHRKSINSFPGDSKATDEEAADDLNGSINQPEAKTDASIVGIISVLLLGCFIANADGSIVLATLGIISSETGNLDNGSWLIITFMLAVCAIQPTYGKLSDLYGRKVTLIFAYTLFTIGCALCGAGQTFWQVALGRAIAGFGGAGMTSLVSVLIADKVPVRDVATWRGYVNIASTVGRSAGGPIGGFLADKIGWRWSFYIQCPLTITAILLVAWKLDGSDTLDSPEADDNKVKKRKVQRIDFLGSITLALTITGFLLVLDLGGQKLPWTHPLIWIIFGAAAVSGTAFGLIEAFVAREPIFPLRLMIHRDVMTAYMISALQVAAQFGVMYTVPLYFQVTSQVSATNAGLHLFPAVCGNAIGGLLAGIIIKRTASYKLLTLLGAISQIVSYILLILRWRGNTSVWESLYIAPGGLGSGIMNSAVFIALAAGVDETQMAISSTGYYLAGNIGALIGASVASNILVATLKSGLENALRGVEGGDEVIEKAVSNLGFVNSLEGGLREVVVGCYIRSFEYTHVMSLAFAALAFLVGVTMKEHRL